IALLELAPSLFPVDLCGEAIAAALTIVADAEALILDLRENGGGDPATVALVCSYLLDEPTHLNTMYFRDGESYRQSWSLPHVPGKRFGGTKPVYVLTSGRTFSGAEELSYDLQQLGRATVVGEQTGGGAHPRRGFRVHPHLEATIPTGRAINPVSGTNWELVGVTPDIEVPAEEALDRALREALRK
ncbi:MAG: S41 family peptidase, partial [Umezawaea sp.]